MKQRLLTVVAFVTITACGGPAEPPPVAPGAPAVASGVAMPPLVDEAMVRVQGLIADPNDAAIKASFSPTFLAAIPPDKVKAVFIAAKAGAGECKERRAMVVKSETGALVRLQCERGALNATIAVNPAPPHLIEGLLLQPTP